VAKKPQIRAKAAKPPKGKGSSTAKRASTAKPGKPSAKPAKKSAPKRTKSVAKAPRAEASPKKAPKPAAKAPAPAKVAGKSTPAPKIAPAPKPPVAGPKAAAPGKPGASNKPAPAIKPAAGGKAGEKSGPGAAGKVPAGAAPAPAAAAAADGKGGRKGITIVSKPRRSGPRQEKIQIPKMEPLLGPGSPFRKPLIASGPGAVRRTLEIDPESLAKLKSPFGKKDLQRFRDILLKKRADLVGDVSDLESEALLGRSGSLSALPQHIAEQGSETYEQSLSLNLAAEDRRLIREIDAALQRIDKGTFGICEMTGKPISRERLEELPWTRYSIEAARESERRSLGGR
jgi:RNA polymerase-binding transcription factor DksA